VIGNKYVPSSTKKPKIPKAKSEPEELWIPVDQNVEAKNLLAVNGCVVLRSTLPSGEERGRIVLGPGSTGKLAVLLRRWLHGKQAPKG
jgi:hypothetical protein